MPRAVEQLVGDHLELGGHPLLRLFQLGLLVVQLLLQSAVALLLRRERSVQRFGLLVPFSQLRRLLAQAPLHISTFLCVLFADQGHSALFPPARPPRKAHGTGQHTYQKTDQQGGDIHTLQS